MNELEKTAVEEITSEERQTSFHDMITLVLDTVVKITNQK